MADSIIVPSGEIAPSIATELAAILEAVYGEEVRGSIHSAIEKTYGIVRSHTFALVDGATTHGCAIESYACGQLIQGLSDRIDGVDHYDELDARLKLLEYKPLEITTFNITSPAGGLVEDGSSVSTVTVEYAFNKTVTATGYLYIYPNGGTETIDSTFKNVKNGTITTQARTLTSNTNLKLFDMENDNPSGTSPAVAQKTLTLTFTNKVHWGASAEPSAINDTFLLTTLSNHTLATSRKRTISVNSTAGKYVWYALPASYGTPTFTYGVLSGGFQKVSTFNHTNASGKSVSYQVWRSDNPNLGNVSIEIT